ncbi:MAG: histidine triad nucleotide-binding protein [Chloroflexi bacterium]|nr:histidine triad nucleotide-binding protein [Chloroflexota bacterium]
MTDCIFCRIVRGEIPSQTVYQNEWVTAFHDIAPKAPVHILIVSNKHLSGPLGVEETDAPIIGEIALAANRIARQLGFAANGFRLVANEGHDGSQSVAHLHFHLLAGRRLGWPPG